MDYCEDCSEKGDYNIWDHKGNLYILCDDCRENYPGIEIKSDRIKL